MSEQETCTATGCSEPCDGTGLYCKAHKDLFEIESSVHEAHGKHAVYKDGKCVSCGCGPDDIHYADCVFDHDAKGAHSAVIGQVTDNPFSGFGRPFSNDNPLMSEQYFQDNPAAATGPYAGGASYSINTTAPYNTPGGGQENPSQNVGPYNPPGHVPVLGDGDFDEDDVPATAGQDSDNDVNQATAAVRTADYDPDSQDPAEPDTDDPEYLEQLLGEPGDKGDEWCDCGDKTQAQPHKVEDCELNNLGLTATGRKVAELNEAYEEWNEANGWYDGTTESIYNHLITAEKIRKEASAYGDTALEDTIIEQIEVLLKVANEIDDSNLHDYLEEVPGGTVAMEYDDLTDGGLVDLDSLIHTTAAVMIQEVNSIDWDTYKDSGARQWVSKKINDNPGILNHETLTRESAVDYIKDKTMVLMDPVYRSQVVDGFVTNVERYRREAAKQMQESLKQSAEAEGQKEAIRQAEARRQIEAELNIDEFFPGAYVPVDTVDYDEQGLLRIGDDDGTPLYESAQKAIASRRDIDWPTFTTEGAREWFSEQAAKNATMLKHADVTYRAAAAYADDKARFVKDSSVHSEIVRAFTESVEFLRNNYENQRTASVTPDVDDAFTSVYENESEILW